MSEFVMNSEQRHIIKRQTIELKVEGGTPSQSFQAEISHIYRQRIVPLINEYCTALSTPDHIYRLDILEIDLGFIDFQNFETDFVAKLRTALYSALANQIYQQEQTLKQQEQNLKTHSQLELLAFFVQTGNLPWWAETTRPQLLEECLQYLIQTAPESLCHLMKTWSQQQQALHRIVFYYQDELLSELAHLLAPSLNHSLATVPQIVSLLLQKSPIVTNKSTIQLKQHIWYTILSVLSLAGTQLAKPELLYQAVLARIAIELKITYQSLLFTFYPVLLATDTLIPNELKNILEDLYQEQIDNSKIQLTASETPYPSETEQNWIIILQQHAETMNWSAQEISKLTQIIQLIYPNSLKSDQTAQDEILSSTPQLPTKLFLNELWIQLADYIVLFPTSIQNKLHQTFQIITNRLTKDEKLPTTIWLDLLRLLRPFLTLQNQHASSKPNELSLQQSLDPQISETLFKLTGKIYDIWNQQDNNNTTIKNNVQLDLHFSEAEELYISNAGLVILWPFLSDFFNHLHLLTKNQQFKNLAAVQRAVTLLQYLANENNNFPEYWLTLNKILCGMAITDVYDLESPLLEAELNECTTLLQAVIARAPILRDMSESALRNTFLLRTGVVTGRDGAWLLRVERETYDIVLDRFPWSWNWIKLPWMEVPIKVEW